MKEARVFSKIANVKSVVIHIIILMNHVSRALFITGGFNNSFF